MAGGSIRIALAAWLLLAAWAGWAQSPREQLQQLSEQLRKSPMDLALRERIVKLGAEIKPPPAIPEEAERRMARGAAAVSGARSPADYEVAINEFEAAVAAAPWWADAYFNLGIAYDKAGRYPQALVALKWVLMGTPDSRETRNLLYQVEFRAEQQAREQKQQQERDRAKAEREGWARSIVSSLNQFFGAGRIVEELFCARDLNRGDWRCSESEAAGINWHDRRHRVGESVKFVQSARDPSRVELHMTRNNLREEPTTWIAEPSGPNPDTDIGRWACTARNKIANECDESLVRLQWLRYADGKRGIRLVTNCQGDRCYRSTYKVSP